jgi:hypothetical protein
MMVFSGQLAEIGGARPPLQYLNNNSSYVAPSTPSPARHGCKATSTQINLPSPLLSGAGYDSTCLLIRYVHYQLALKYTGIKFLQIIFVKR